MRILPDAGRYARPLPAVAALLASLVLATAAAGQGVTSRYDTVFRKYSKRFFGVGFDWRMFKAQAMTESNLNPDASSRAGARGIMQLMPSTFLEVQSKNQGWASIDDPEWNIAAGMYYDRRLWRLWRDSVDTEDHRHFMFGSYNAGRSPILRAQGLARRRALDPRYWASIEAVAAHVRRWRHRETIRYVQRIQGNLARMDEHGRVVKKEIAD